MAVEIRVPTGKGIADKSSAGRNMERKQDSMTKSLAKIAVASAATALIWKALEPILTPLVKLLSLIALIVFLPLLPYVKDMAEKLKEVALNIRKSQGGDTPIGQFVGGLGAFIADEYWTIAGGLLAVALIGAMSGGALLGALALVLGTSLAFSKIGESEIQDKLAVAGIIGLAAGVATSIATGNPIAATLVGGLAFSLATKLDFGTITKEKLTTVLKASGIVGIASFLAVGIMTGAWIPAVLVGSITFILSMIFDLTREEEPKFDQAEIDRAIKGYTGTAIIEPTTFELPVDFKILDESINQTEGEWIKLNKTMNDDLLIMPFNITTLADEIGDTSSTSSLITNINSTSEGWTAMGVNSLMQINSIIANLLKIPRKITTIHEIVTVRRDA